MGSTTEATRVHKRADGALAGEDDGGGWVLRTIAPDLLEYSAGESSCIVNVGRPIGVGAEATQRVFASDFSAEHFPHLREHLEAALPHLNGRFELA